MAWGVGVAPASANYIATIGTILNQPTQLAGVGTIGTILSPVEVFGTVIGQRYLSLLSLENAASLVGGFVASFDMSMYDSVNVDIIVGTLTPATGSLQVAAMSVEMLTGLISSTIVSSYWLTNGQRQRITVPNALGEVVAITASIIGTATGITMSALRKS